MKTIPFLSIILIGGLLTACSSVTKTQTHVPEKLIPHVVFHDGPLVEAPKWTVSPQDKTIRNALKGWAIKAGWSFEPEHWAVPVDIPITASSTFTGDFKLAARQLIRSTELGSTPLQPCFYTNKVVRVVPINEMCDPASTR